MRKCISVESLENTFGVMYDQKTAVKLDAPAISGLWDGLWCDVILCLSGLWPWQPDV